MILGRGVGIGSNEDDHKRAIMIANRGEMPFQVPPCRMQRV